MKPLSFFIVLLFFLPFTLHAKIDKKEYKSKRSKVGGYSFKAMSLLHESTQCAEDQEEKIISLLEEAIENSHHALAILHELIEELQKAKPKAKSWQAEALENCKSAMEETKAIIEGYTFILNRNKWNLCVRRINQYNLQIDNKKGEVNQKLADLPNLTEDQKIQHLRGSIELVKEVTDLHEKCLYEISRLQDPAACKGIEPIRIQIERSLEENRNFLALLEKETFQLDEAVRSKDSRAEALKLFESAKKKGETAALKTKELYHPNKIIEASQACPLLNEAAVLYQEAAQECRDALSSISAFTLSEDKEILEKAVQNFEDSVNFCLAEAGEWTRKEEVQRENLKRQLQSLEENCASELAKGMLRSAWTFQKQMLPILQELVRCQEAEEERLITLQKEIELYEKAQDENRITEVTASLSSDQFFRREQQRKDNFFKLNFSRMVSPIDFLKKAFPLDGQKEYFIHENEKEYLLFADQFYRFLIPNIDSQSKIYVKIFDKENLIHVEEISLSLNEIQKVFSVKLNKEHYLDLRLRIFSEFDQNLSLLLTHRGIKTDLHFKISIGEEELYSFHVLDPPPWQLEALRKPSVSQPTIQTENVYKNNIPLSPIQSQETTLELANNPILDRFVQEMKSNPLALAQYVQNEIELFDPFVFSEGGVLQPPPIHRSAFGTFMEKQGSAWEQCALLIYLLRKAGYQAVYACGQCEVETPILEKMLNAKLPETQTTRLNYPWVLFFDGSRWIPLFPWLKEMIVKEGFDLYGWLPDEYASAKQWILQYLTNDEKILKHIGPDGDDTAALLFVRFLEEELRRQGLSIFDVGNHSKINKRQYGSWEDFPRADIKGEIRTLSNLLNQENLFAAFQFEISSLENPEKKISLMPFALAGLNGTTFGIHFTPDQEKNHLLHLTFPETSFQELCLDLDPSDQSLEIKIGYLGLIGTSHKGIEVRHKFSFAKGTRAALCFQFGNANENTVSFFAKKFEEVKEAERIHYLLSYIGASYFQRCCRGEKMLAALHKVNPMICFGCGLVKLAPDLSEGPLKGEPNLKYPQVDMIFLGYSEPLSTFNYLEKEKEIAFRQFSSLATIDQSSNEHQILRETFNDPFAISTVKLLQLAHQQHQKEGLPGTGFLMFDNKSFNEAERMPEVAQNLYFSHLKNLNLRHLKTVSKNQWEAAGSEIGQKNDTDSYVYMTPGIVCSLDGAFSKQPSYKGIGTLIISPARQASLISDNMMMMNGGFGSRLNQAKFDEILSQDWKVFERSSLPAFDFSIIESPDLVNFISPYEFTWKSDVRQEHKSYWDTVADPVDVNTGAFYVDEIDLSMPGPFSLELRRNYNNQSIIPGILGNGWKLNLNPFLHQEEDKLYAAEEDGTIIVYRRNSQKDLWEVLPEDNPELRNFNKKGVGGASNCFHSHIKANSQGHVLYGTDGSKRIFEGFFLKEWIDHAGNKLHFLYDKNQLIRIESSHGSFLGFHYDHRGKIVEAYTKDGRRIHYGYNSQEDLTQVVLPNGANIIYEYDRFHRIIRETKPHGRILENIYDDLGRVIEQRSPAGCRQEMVPTAFFSYQDGKTQVKDASGACTEYLIYKNYLYEIIDPLGNRTLQSWFIDPENWFDAEERCLKKWDQPGAWPRSLKSTKDKRGLVKEYSYDDRGNPAEIHLLGQDLTGDGKTKISKRFSYNERNLCVWEETCGKKTEIAYDQTFTYLPKKIETKIGNTVLSSVEYDYNLFGQIEKEDHFGNVVHWKYDDRGFPIQSVQKTGTEDPDVVTSYSYNDQGQCIRKQEPDGLYTYEFDIMGNNLAIRSYDVAGKNVSTIYRGYDLNHRLIRQQGPDPRNTLFLDYNAQGLVKAKRQTLTHAKFDTLEIEPEGIAYTLYDYDPRGHLILETDPLGCSIAREYDPLGRNCSETKQGVSIFCEYEPGGLLAKTVSARGAVTAYEYTTNGLLKKEIFPDGTENSYIYDFFGRPTLEKKNGSAWEIFYEDHERKIVRKHIETGITEIHYFDPHGNEICHLDAEGNRREKTYDSLGRIKTKRDPDGQTTAWNYLNDTWVCTLPGKEKIVQRYELGNLVETTTLDSLGHLLSHHSIQRIPELSIEQQIQEGGLTTTWMNTLGLPVLVQTGNLKHLYRYDPCGQCIASVDGEGRETSRKYDHLGRVVKKILPEGAEINYDYDDDSNLIACHLPGGNTWEASYDLMGRKISECVRAKDLSAQHWEYRYIDGYLREAVDPLYRTHLYTYDTLGRILEEKVNGSHRVFSYNQCGQMATAEQKDQSHSKIERAYDSCGRLIQENIFLDSKLIQESRQTWTPSQRKLQIGDHERIFDYQNGKLKTVSTKGITLSYDYDLNGSLITKKAPNHTISIHYNHFFRPEKIETDLLGANYQQWLSWDNSGKLTAYQTNWPQADSSASYTYTQRGLLKAVNDEAYAFDFERLGPGVRTLAPDWKVPKKGLDPFGKILKENFREIPIQNQYDEMGQLSEREYGEETEQFKWDPWGRLLEVRRGGTEWKAFYDPLGRRLQTHYITVEGEKLETTSFYDPEEEFLEVGVNFAQDTFWKIYGPHSCDAVVDSKGKAVTLIHDEIGNLRALASGEKLFWSENIPRPYGPLGIPSENLGLIPFAKSIAWRSCRQDPTGFIWMGARYYDPAGGRFLSVDPVGYPYSTDLYAYGNGDPVNYIDPDGRFATAAYQTVMPVVIDTLTNPYVQGSLRTFAGYSEANIGASLIFGTQWTGFGPVLGWCLLGHGLDNMNAGISQLCSGRATDPGTVQLLQKTGLSDHYANLANDALSLFGSMGGVAALRSSAKKQFIEFFNEDKSRKITTEFIYNSWDKGTFPNKMQTIRYHWHKHGNGRTIEEYTLDAIKTLNDHKFMINKTILKSGKEGLFIKLNINGKKIGGYWTKSEKIITYWD